MTDEPSALLVDQRIRNRIIDYLEWVSSFDEQLKYQAAVPLVSVPGEAFNQWEDWVHRDPRQYDDHSIVFTSDEVDALRAFHTAWDLAAAQTPNPLPPLAECQRLPPWHDLRDAAESALAVFEIRGRLSDDEVDPSLP